MNNRSNERNNEGRAAERQSNIQENRGNIRPTESRTPHERLNPQRIERPQAQREDRQAQRFERPVERTQPRLERNEQPRIERAEQPRFEQRAERSERFRDNGGGRESRQSNDRSEVRGRER